MVTTLTDAQADAPAHERLRARVVSGSAIMLLGSMFVGGVNLVYNFAVAHKLGAGEFGHASVTYTLLMLLSAVTLSFQLVCSKFVARSSSDVERLAIYHHLHRRAWLYSATVGLLLVIASPEISRYLNLPTTLFLRILAVGIVFYIPLGVRRGLLQGSCEFRALASNLALEVVIKLIGAVVLMSAGYGVTGVVGAMSASLIAAYFLAMPKRHDHDLKAFGQPVLQTGFDEGLQALTFFVGQVIINNLDIVLVKHFFNATQAGTYAAVALIGRLVYILSWSVVSSMFPLSARVRSDEIRGRTVLSTALAIVSLIAFVFTLGAWLAPSSLWQILLGAGFPAVARGFYSSLLVLYIITTAIYSLSVVLTTYEISRKIGNVSWLQLIFSGAIIAGIYLYHSTLQQVITVQLVLMMVLLLTVAIPFSRISASGSRAWSVEGGLRKVRKIDENEVVSEFLRGEFNQHHEFLDYRKPFAHLVANPNLRDERENGFRRALLDRRRGRLWRELPSDTEWWEVELTFQDVQRTRVFARNQWLRYGCRGFSLLDVATRIRTRILTDAQDAFITKLKSLSIEVAEDVKFSSVILIAIDEKSPMTIIEGNHRMTAAALVSPETVHQRFRYLCGFSPRMEQCCWYQTNPSTLFRYARNGFSYHLTYRKKMAEILEQAKSSFPHSENPVI
jgi:O-antigen/teichoic acid export membrane protein